MTSAIGASLRAISDPVWACDEQLTVHRWRLAPDDTNLRGLAVAVAREYVNPQARLSTPVARVGVKLPQRDSVRAGDFGEMIAMGIYSTRMGREVPYSKLQLSKPVADATVQGPDTVCLTITPGEDVQPVVVEAKTRESGQPSAVLPAIADSLAIATQDYLVSAWRAGAELMALHPDHRRSFALAAAQHLGRLNDPEATLPAHLRHAVAIVGTDKLTLEKIEEYWPGAPPVTELHVVEVFNLKALRDRIYETAAKLTYGDLTAQAAPLVARGLPAGISGLISREVPTRLVAATEPHPLSVILESSLWYLANEDGVALARARKAVEHPDPDVKGLAQMLTGAIGSAVTTLSGRPLEHFATVVQDLLQLEKPPAELVRAADAFHGSEGVRHAARHVAAAVLHRLDRHPLTLVHAKGATGDAVRHVVAELQRYGVHAFWPSQAAAVRGGLLDSGQRSLAIKMPTSAGKTTLIQLVVADTVDKMPGGVVAVLAPTRALVGQLQRDLRDGLPDLIPVRSSQGGLDYDTDLPSTPAALDSTGVVVVTPERFDLEWRRAVTGDSPVDLDQLKLLVVDEAQHIDIGVRGATLERVIARALQRGIRVVLLSSQFSDVGAVADWINGRPLESGWRPAWLERHVFVRGLQEGDSKTARKGYLWPEGGDPVESLTLKPSAKTKGEGWIRDRKHEAAGLIDKYEHEGLVVVFTANKGYAPALFKVIMDELPASPPPRPTLAKLADSIAALHPEEAEALRRGFALHHADVPSAVKRAIEVAARKDGGLLRCIVCTSTLLEGVDFPARTVIAAYPPRDTSHRPDIARLRNLEGRAGRGGKYTSGRLVVMTSDHVQARTWRRAFRDRLPPTETALTAALRELRHRRPDWMADDAREIINALTIEALAESAAADGDLRLALERTLERTVWSATSPPAIQQQTMANAAGYGTRLAAVLPDRPMREAVYRSGLRVKGCLTLRDELENWMGDIIAALTAQPPDEQRLDRLLHWLIEQSVRHLDELESLSGAPASSLRGALAAWLVGTPEDVIELAHPAAWDALSPRQRETMIPWALTGAFEIIAALAGDLQLREAAHRRLGPGRIRYGVPDADLCELVRDGADRVAVARIAADVKAEWPGGTSLWTLRDVVEYRLNQEAEAAELLESARPAGS